MLFGFTTVCSTCCSPDLLTYTRWSSGSLWVIHLLLFWSVHLHAMILRFPQWYTCFSSDLFTCMWGSSGSLSDTPASLLICSLTRDDLQVPSVTHLLLCPQVVLISLCYWPWMTGHGTGTIRTRNPSSSECSTEKSPIMWVFGHQVICSGIILTLWLVYTNWNRNSIVNLSILQVASDGISQKAKKTPIV